MAVAEEVGVPLPVGSDAAGVYRELRRAILHAEIPIDEPISQVKLAKQLGVSRTPLREALRMLERDGLIEAKHNRQVRVAPISVEDLEQLYAMRIMLEAVAIRVTVPKLTDSDFNQIEARLAEMEEFGKSHDVAAWSGPHREFHRLLIHKAGDRLVSQIAELSDHSERYRRINLNTPIAWTHGSKDHQAIADACREGDSTSAAIRLAEHLSKTALTVVAVLDPSREPTTVREALRFFRPHDTVASPAAGQKGLGD